MERERKRAKPSEMSATAQTTQQDSVYEQTVAERAAVPHPMVPGRPFHSAAWLPTSPRARCIALCVAPPLTSHSAASIRSTHTTVAHWWRTAVNRRVKLGRRLRRRESHRKDKPKWIAASVAPRGERGGGWEEGGVDEGKRKRRRAERARWAARGQHNKHPRDASSSDFKITATTLALESSERKSSQISLLGCHRHMFVCVEQNL